MAFQNTRYNYKIQEEENNPKMSWDSIFEKWLSMGKSLPRR
jgi:hypothetical protein